MRRIVEARRGDFGEELEEGLAIWAQGEQVFEAWLVRPFPAVELGDTLETARDVLALLVGRIRRAGSGREVSGLAEKVIGAVNGIERILARRPQPPRRDAIVEELERLDREWRAVIERPLVEIERRASVTA